MKNSRFANIYSVYLLFFVAIPLFLIGFYAFTKSDGGTIYFSVENFNRFFSNDTYAKVLLRSIKLAFQSTIICLILGYPLAYIIARENANRKSVMLLMVVIPMWMNFLLRTYAWSTLLGKNGLINKFFNILGFETMQLLYTDGAVLLGMVYNFLPFMILPIYSVLTKMNPKLFEAASDLGASKIQVFQKITLPLSVPGILSGVSMVFIPAVSTFVISSILGGNKYNLIGNVIEQQFRWTGDWHFGSTISVILMVFILIVMAVTNKFGGSQTKGDGIL